MSWLVLNWLFNTLRSNPQIAILLAVAVGFYLGGRKFGNLSQGKVRGVLIGQLNLTLLHRVGEGSLHRLGRPST